MENIWYGDEPVSVEARLLPDGKIHPTAFSWRGRRQSVTGLGRQWEAADGRHVLVTTGNGNRYELCLSSDQKSWRLRRAWERPYLA
ncbi:MAG: hypothetical protein Kow0063_04560 [Anaerolineae bacterium]